MKIRKHKKAPVDLGFGLLTLSVLDNSPLREVMLGSRQRPRATWREQLGGKWRFSGGENAKHQQVGDQGDQGGTSVSTY